MLDLLTFDSGLSIDSQPENLLDGLVSGFLFAQDNANGFPAYANVDADKLYRDTYPVRLEVTESVKAGQLLNVFYSDIPRARLATASDKAKYANSMALTSANIGELAWCAVKVGVTPYPNTGDLWLSATPGEATQTPEMSMEIIQRVGTAKAGIFQFYFHTPALTKPLTYHYLTRSA